MRKLVLVTVSGSQASGKSTLLSALVDEWLNETHGGATVQRLPSFSSNLFQRWRDGTLHNAPPPVTTFDEIDQLGHRDWFQSQLPNSVAFEVEAAAQKANAELNFILCDRWFPDVQAHARLCLPESEHARHRALCTNVYRALMLDLHTKFAVVSISFYIPVTSCRFAVHGQEGKFRATFDRELFDRVCLEEWPHIVERQPITVTASALKPRVFDMKMAITRALHDFNHAATRSS